MLQAELLFGGNHIYEIALSATVSAMLLLFLTRKLFFSKRNILLRAWINLFVYGAFVALAAKLFALPDANFAMLCAAGILAVFLFESILIRINVHFFDMDGSGLFLKYTPAENAWRPDRKFLKMKRAIESAGMKKQNSYINLSAKGFRDDEYKTTFRSADGKSILEVSFEGLESWIVTSARAVSLTADGVYIVTASTFDSAGFPPLPDNIIMENAPLNSDPLKTLRRHKKRTEKREDLKEIDDAVFENINAAIEDKCVEEGLLNAPQDRDDYGLLSAEGKFRVWKSALSLIYFGR